MDNETTYATDVQVVQPGQETLAPAPVESIAPITETTQAEQATATEEQAAPIETKRAVEITANNKATDSFSWDNIDDKAKNTFIEKASNGQIKDLSNLSSILKENQELKTRTAEPQFESEKQKSLYEFLSKYSGDDYAVGLQHYIRLDSIDTKSLDFKSAIKEQYIIENLKIGIPAHLSEQNFEDEFQEKYSEDDNRTPFKLQREGELAKRFLASEKDSIKTTLPVKNEVDTAKQEQEQRQYQAAIQDYEAKVKKTLYSDQGEFDSLDFSFGDTPEEQFSFKIPDIAPIEEGLMDYQEGFFNPRYAIRDSNGAITSFDTEKMRNDLAILNHYPDMLAQTAEHFKKVGTLEAIKQRANITTPEQRQSVMPSTGGDNRYASDVVIVKR